MMIETNIGMLYSEIANIANLLCGGLKNKCACGLVQLGLIRRRILPLFQLSPSRHINP
jgi:hypothetical protein